MSSEVDSPSNLPKAKARPGSLVDSAKSWSLTVRSPMVMTSRSMIPSRLPEPYLENRVRVSFTDRMNRDRR